MTSHPIVGELTAHRLLAVLRGPDPDRLIAATEVLAEEGVRYAEVSLTSAAALDVLRRLRESTSGRMVLGAGTVLTGEQARAAVDAGAEFLVTPSSTAELDDVLAAGPPVLGGALTPTEVRSAHARGCAAVKLFPASLHGPGYVRALLDPFPDVPLVPVGGVGQDTVADYLAAGAVAVGVGSPLLGDAAAGGDLGALRQRVQRFLDAVRAG